MNTATTVKNRIAPNGQQQERVEKLTIAPLREAVLSIPIVGTTPLKCLRFSQKKQQQVRETQEAGEKGKNRNRKRAAKDFQGEYEEAKYFCVQKGDKGKQTTWLGINASGVRNGCIETCRVAGFAMTKAKMTIFCEADGRDAKDGTPLIRIDGEPRMVVDHVRNASGVIDLRPRVCWDEWKAVLRLRYDEDQFDPSDIVNLVIRVGRQNGLGEGRPNGRDGNGTDCGLFQIQPDGIVLRKLDPMPRMHIEEV